MNIFREAVFIFMTKSKGPESSRRYERVPVPDLDDEGLYVLRRALETTLNVDLRQRTIDLEPE